jgi:hypothetical protein
MNTSAPTRRQLIATIKKLPAETLPELANFLTYLQFKSASPPRSEATGTETRFLLAIAGIGSGEEDLSERDEEILTQEIDPIRGWSFDDGGSA